MKKAGQKIGQSGQDLGTVDSEEEWDPLLQDSGATGTGEGAPRDGIIDTDTGAMPGIDDLRIALEEAGIALETAGHGLEDATTDGALAAAEAAIAEARLKILIAGQELLETKAELEELPGLPGMEDIFEEAETALQEANVAIIVATGAIFSTDIEFPDDIDLGTRGEAPKSELDKELDQSIAIFEGKIMDARQAVIDTMPAPHGASSIPGLVILGGTEGEGIDEPEAGGLESAQEPAGDKTVPVIIASTAPPPIPDDIPSAQGDDIVARQLREAAQAETDPELRKKLWEEYKKYKENL